MARPRADFPPPERLRALADADGRLALRVTPGARSEALEIGEGAVLVKVRAKAKDGEVRFFGDSAEPVDKAVENVVAGLRVHLAPRSAEIEALKRRLEGVTSSRGGEIVLVAGIGGGREIELKLPGRFSLDPAVRGALKTTPGVVFVEDL